MSRYEGLDDKLRKRVRERDKERCRWCGRTGLPVDPHHIRYRRSAQDDVEENLICLCRRCHEFVHGAKNAKGEIIPKVVAQVLLWELIGLPGTTGMALWRQKKREFAEAGLCQHGRPDGNCYICTKTEEYAK